MAQTPAIPTPVTLPPLPQSVPMPTWRAPDDQLTEGENTWACFTDESAKHAGTTPRWTASLGGDPEVRQWRKILLGNRTTNEVWIGLKEDQNYWSKRIHDSYHWFSWMVRDLKETGSEDWSQRTLGRGIYLKDLFQNGQTLKISASHRNTHMNSQKVSTEGKLLIIR